MSVRSEPDGPVAVITIDRPERRNAVDSATAAALVDAFRRFDGDASLSLAILTGAGGTFCAGADLKAIAGGRGLSLTEEGEGPMGPSRMRLGKPVIAAIEGHAVAGGLELARRLAALPQAGLRNDRLSAIEQWGMSEEEAMHNEFRRGLETLASGEGGEGAARFAAGEGRPGEASQT